ncbi:12117_t:CDS:2, partial [Gigaspora rosea]
MISSSEILTHDRWVKEMFFIEFPVAPRMMLLHALWRCNEGQAAGFEIGALGCSYCITVAADHAGNGEVWLSSQNRNFRNQMSKGAIGNLAFAAIVAASSLQYSVTKSLADVIITGKVQRFEDNINTDAIIPAQFIPGIDDEALVVMHSDIRSAESSERCGVKAVIAKSYTYRNQGCGWKRMGSSCSVEASKGEDCGTDTRELA